MPESSFDDKMSWEKLEVEKKSLKSHKSKKKAADYDLVGLNTITEYSLWYTYVPVLVRTEIVQTFNQKSRAS